MVLGDSVVAGVGIDLLVIDLVVVIDVVVVVGIIVEELVVVEQ